VCSIDPFRLPTRLNFVTLVDRQRWKERPCYRKDTNWMWQSHPDRTKTIGLGDTPDTRLKCGRDGEIDRRSRRRRRRCRAVPSMTIARTWSSESDARTFTETGFLRQARLARETICTSLTDVTPKENSFTTRKKLSWQRSLFFFEWIADLQNR